MGCRYCSWACPFDAPRLRIRSGVMSKCTCCNHRLVEKLKPACVTSCPTGALGFGSLFSMSSGTVAGFPVTACRPSVALRPLRDGAAGPECASEGEASELVSAPSSTERRIALRSEWPLLVLTQAAVSLVALAVGWLPGRGGPARSLLVVGAAAAMALSLLHLGSKLRAWRALMNIRRSWLSREIAAFALFMVALGAPLVPRLTHQLWDWVALVSGFFLLWTIDRVYDVLPLKVPALFHSGGALLTGVFLTGCVARLPLVAGPAAVLKLGLYVGRFFHSRSQAVGSHSAIRAAVRLGLPLIAGALYMGRIAPAWSALLLVIAAETVDRAEFYLELNPPSLSRDLERDLRESIGQSRDLSTGTVS
jgi:DMSO reductase anchor subunit